MLLIVSGLGDDGLFQYTARRDVMGEVWQGVWFIFWNDNLN